MDHTQDKYVLMFALISRRNATVFVLKLCCKVPAEKNEGVFNGVLNAGVCTAKISCLYSGCEEARDSYPSNITTKHAITFKHSNILGCQ